MTEKTLEYRIHNKNPEPLIVIIEPWAEEVTLPPGSSLALKILYDKEDLMEVVTRPNYLTVWLWGGCRVQLAMNGEHLKMPSLLIPSP